MKLFILLIVMLSLGCTCSHFNQADNLEKDRTTSHQPRALSASTASTNRGDVDRWRRKQENNKNRVARIAKRMKMLAELNENTKLRLDSKPQAFPVSDVKSVSPVLFYETFGEKSAIPMSGREGNNSRRCSFLAAECDMEITEHSLVNAFFRPDDQVLELGGRFGTTSCAIAAKQGNSGKLVVVEPDFNVWYLLEANRKTHLCNFWTFRGIVSQQTMVVSEASYATRTLPNQKPTVITRPAQQGPLKTYHCKTYSNKLD